MRPFWRFVLLSLLALALLPLVRGEPTVDVALYPEPLFGQIYPLTEYTVMARLNYSQNTAPSPPTGALNFTVSIVVRLRGSYHFGESVTGYSMILREEGFWVEAVGGAHEACFNWSLDKDYFELGAMPYEDVQVEFNLRVLSEGSVLAVGQGVFHLVDSSKEEYVLGKISEMAGEVGLIQELDLDRDISNYVEALGEAQASMAVGDVVGALKVVEVYEDRMRPRLIVLLSRALEESLGVRQELEAEVEGLVGELEECAGLEAQLESLESTLETLSLAYTEANKALGEARRNLTWALTGVFAAGFLGFFAGRWSLGRWG